MFKTGVKHNLNAYHALRGDFGEESIPHTHPYIVEWTVWNDDLDENGFATDIAAMEQAMKDLSEELDGVFLNDLPFFSGRQTSLENLSMYLHDRLKAALDRAPKRMEVAIWESDSAYASYET
jgi:6-pyruvoyl-tetrahydropterin synthase